MEKNIKNVLCMLNKKLSFMLLFLCMSILVVGCGKKDKNREIEEIYGNVYERWMEAKILIYGALIETGEKVTDKNGQVYFVVEEPAYQDLESIRTVLNSAFSATYIETYLSWVLGGERPFYKEIDGRLCVAEMDAVGESPTKEIVSVLDWKEDEIKIKVAADDADDFFEFYEITLVQEGNGWVIDQLQEMESDSGSGAADDSESYSGSKSDVSDGGGTQAGGTIEESTQGESTEKVRYIYGETAIPDIPCGDGGFEGKADLVWESEDSVKLQQSLDSMVFETHTFGDYTVRLVGDSVRTDEANFPGSIYVQKLRVELEKNRVLIEEDCRYNGTVTYESQFLTEYRLFADKIGNYLDVYDLDCPVIAMRYYFDDDPERTVMAAVEFAVIQDNELLYGFVGVFEEGLGVMLNPDGDGTKPGTLLALNSADNGVCRAGIFSSDEFKAADGKTLIDEEAGIRYTFDFSDPLPFELYTAEYLVVYNWNNADSDARPRSGRLTDDWNGDGTEDALIIEVTEQEGSEVIKKLELSMSGSDASYVIRNQNYYFIDIIPGNFDSDADTEVLLVFDMRYAGGNGTLGIQLLDFNGSEYVNITDDFFTGYEYSVDVKAGENGSYLISRADGKEMIINESYIYESAIGTVTGFYFLDVLEKDGVNYIRIKQYVAGEDMTDHVGDVVCVLGVSDGGLTLLDEKVKVSL